MNLKYLLIFSVMTLPYGCTPETSITQPIATEALASPVGSTHQQNIKSGTFIAGEHETTGEVKIFTENGKTYLELDKAFNTSTSGPSLYIVLHRSDNVLATTEPPAYPLKEGDYVLIAPLQKYSGSQRYLIPQNINLKNYQSAVIWCRPFNATFGTAKLRDL